MARPMPEYMKIREHLLKLISVADGPGQIPPENELCQLFGVTRCTARNAIKGLVDDGYLIPRRGLGTFVNPAKVETDIVRTPRLGLLQGDGHAANSFYTSHLRRIMEVNGLGHEPLYRPNSESTQRLVEMAKAGLDAVVWVEPSQDCLGHCEALAATGIPLLLLSYEATPFDTIRLPEAHHAGSFIAEALFAKGHSRFAYIHNSPRSDGRLDPGSWLAACCRRMAELSGEPLPPADRFVLLKDFPALVKRRRAEPGLFSALYAVNSVVPKLMKALRQEGLAAPRDVSILSYDEPEALFFDGVKPEFIDLMPSMRRAFFDWREKRLDHGDRGGVFHAQVRYSLAAGDTVRDIRNETRRLET